MYEDSKATVGLTKRFNVKIGQHQGPAFSSFLFAVVTDKFAIEIRQKSTWTKMFAEDILLHEKSKKDVKLNLKAENITIEKKDHKSQPK